MNNALLLSSIFDFKGLIEGLLSQHGIWVYVVLIAIIFVETGLVIFPFLPGDSILFLAGSLSATNPKALNPWLLTILLIIAAVAGDFINFEVGKRFGRWVIEHKKFRRFLKPEYIERSEHFFQRYGKLAIFLGRFVPIIRTVIPFTAGMSDMHYPSFARFNIIGAISWIVIAGGAGYLFGNIPFVQNNFELIMVAIIFISVIPVFITWLNSRKKTAK